MQPRIFGPYEPIRRDYPIEEFCADIRGCGVVQSVYVQANWEAERFQDEAAWVQRTADESGWPHAIVGYADLTSADARLQLDALASYRLMRGVRMQLHWHHNAAYCFAARPDLCDDQGLIANVRRLADYGWSFELQVFAGQMQAAARLAEACPKVTLVLQHAGMLEDLSPAGREAWLSGMGKLAARPNVVAKLSGFGTFIHRNDPDHIAWLVAHTVALFGAERCLFGSNFPIEKLWTSYRELLDAHLQATGQLTPAQRSSIFGDTARRVYRLAPGTQP